MSSTSDVCPLCGGFGDKPHGEQQTFTDASGTERFRRNEIVRMLLDLGPFDLNS